MRSGGGGSRKEVEFYATTVSFTHFSSRIVYHEPTHTHTPHVFNLLFSLGFSLFSLYLSPEVLLPWRVLCCDLYLGRCRAHALSPPEPRARLGIPTRACERASAAPPIASSKIAALPRTLVHTVTALSVSWRLRAWVQSLAAVNPHIHFHNADVFVAGATIGCHRGLPTHDSHFNRVCGVRKGVETSFCQQPRVAVNLSSRGGLVVKTQYQGRA